MAITGRKPKPAELKLLTGNPVANPYLAIRDRAEKKLSRMLNIRADGLW